MTNAFQEAVQCIDQAADTMAAAYYYAKAGKHIHTVKPMYERAKMLIHRVEELGNIVKETESSVIFITSRVTVKESYNQQKKLIEAYITAFEENEVPDTSNK